jgi:hypothetical protein
VSVRARAAAPAPARRRQEPARTRPVEHTRPSRRPSSRTHARPRRRTRLLVRWVWAPALAVMLGGIVFINATTLRLSTRSSLTLQRTSEAQAEIVNLNQALQQTDAQVRNAATRELGMKQEVASQVTFLSAPNPTP